MRFDSAASYGELNPDGPPWADPKLDPLPLTPRRKAVRESTVGVLASRGVRYPTQPPLGTTRDLTCRLVERDWRLEDLVLDHATPVRIWADEDLNVADPRDRWAGARGRRDRRASGAAHGLDRRLDHVLDRAVGGIATAMPPSAWL